MQIIRYVYLVLYTLQYCKRITEVSHCQWNQRVTESPQSPEEGMLLLDKNQSQWMQLGVITLQSDGVEWHRKLTSTMTTIVHDYTPQILAHPKTDRLIHCQMAVQNSRVRIRQAEARTCTLRYQRQRYDPSQSPPTVLMPTNVWEESTPTDLTWSCCVSSKSAAQFQFILHKNHSHDSWLQWLYTWYYNYHMWLFKCLSISYNSY